MAVYRCRRHRSVRKMLRHVHAPNKPTARGSREGRLTMNQLALISYTLPVLRMTKTNTSYPFSISTMLIRHPYQEDIDIDTSTAISGKKRRMPGYHLYTQRTRRSSISTNRSQSLRQGKSWLRLFAKTCDGRGCRFPVYLMSGKS
jgi:hypothetical protein